MTQTQTYSTPGSYNFVVPAQCTSIGVVCRGAQGAAGSPPGLGGSVSGTLAVTPGETLVIFVGGIGGSPSGPTGGGAGFNGGAGGGTCAISTGGGGWGGGGASDVRQGGTALSNRKAVGAGGGGASRGTGPGGAAGGGAGGTTTGQSGSTGNTDGTTLGTAATGGTQSAGGAHGTVGGNGGVGTLGVGGAGGGGGSAVGSGGGGGGGGGYYGGGGGGGSNHNPSGSGSGAGGSNYVGGLTTTNSIRGDNAGNGIVTLTFNSPPNAPSLVSPPNNSFVDDSQATTFMWNYSDPDPSDTQGSYTFRWRTGTGAWTTVGPTTSSDDFFTTGSGAWTSLAGTQVEWQMMVTDSEGATSLWSPSSFFTPQSPPDAPTIDPSTAINSPTPSVAFTTDVPMVAYQAIVVNDVSGAPGTTTLVDTTEVDVTGGPEANVASLPVFAYVNGTSYHVLVRIQQYLGVWSAYADSGPLVADVNAPLQPTCTLDDNTDTGTIVVTITNPGSDPFPPDYNDIYRTDVTRAGDEIRIATQVALNAIYLDTRAGFNTEYRYRIVAVTGSGATTSSE